MGAGGSVPNGLACLATLEGHKSGVLGVACFKMPDGSPRVVSASRDNTLRVWDPLNKTHIATLEGHTNVVRGVACFKVPGGSPRVVSASDDKTLRVWGHTESARKAALEAEAQAKAQEAAAPKGRFQEAALDNACAFFFADANFIRMYDGDALPVFQEMRTLGKLTEAVVEFSDVMRAAYRFDTLAVSHRWETPKAPDPKGEQLRVLKEHLRAHPKISRVWIDWCCMPQGERSATDLAAFKRMLPRINMLYLGCAVLLIVDNTYVGRFWTQFEAWLAMRSCSPSGLGPTVENSERYVMQCIHLAQDKFQGAQLREMWREASSKKAYEALSSPDVTVTNQSDKDVQLPKLQALDEQVRRAFALAADAASDPSASASAEELPAKLLLLLEAAQARITALEAEVAAAVAAKAEAEVVAAAATKDKAEAETRGDKFRKAAAHWKQQYDKLKASSGGGAG